jgi:hypothetical protein
LSSPFNGEKIKVLSGSRTISGDYAALMNGEGGTGTMSTSYKVEIIENLTYNNYYGDVIVHSGSKYEYKSNSSGTYSAESTSGSSNWEEGLSFIVTVSDGSNTRNGILREWIKSSYSGNTAANTSNTSNTSEVWVNDNTGIVRYHNTYTYNDSTEARKAR